MQLHEPQSAKLGSNLALLLAGIHYNHGYGAIMFEHKNLDGQWNRVVSASEPFLSNEILEIRENVSPNCTPETSSRKQYGVIGDQLVERCLPPENIGDRWSYDDCDVSWWTRVNNPPHMGIIAEFNESQGGKHHIPLDTEQNVVAYAASGEQVLLKQGQYFVTRNKDNKEITADSLIETRRAYYEEA